MFQQKRTRAARDWIALSAMMQSCKPLNFRVFNRIDVLSLSVPVFDRIEQTKDARIAARSPMQARGGQRTARRSLITWLDVASVLCVAFLATIVFTDFADPSVTEGSDYVSSFYVAGRLAAAGEFDRLYPSPDAVSFRDSPFNASAHQLLPRLRKETITNFMYPPIVAWVFAPLSVLPPHVSLLVWQMISLLALGLACFFLSRTTEVRARDLFVLSSLFFPILMAVLIGQAGIPFGLLPLSVGYWLLSRGSPLAAGFAWAGLALKPQFLPAAGLMSVAYAVTGRIRLLSGMILGLCVWVALNYFLVPAGTLTAWTRSLRVSDAIFSGNEYQVPVHLLASIPADVMMRFPPEARISLKPVLYGLSVGLGMLALWQSRTILRSRLREERGRLAVFTMSLTILPLTSPHLLYYDLVILFPMGLILLDCPWSRLPLAGLRRTVIVSWWTISAYFLFFSFVGVFSLTSLIELVILFAAWTLFVEKAVHVAATAVSQDVSTDADDAHRQRLNVRPEGT